MAVITELTFPETAQPDAVPHQRAPGKMVGHNGGPLLDDVQPLPNVPGERISYTLRNASDAVDLSIATLRRLNKAGRLRFIKIGGRTLVCAKSLHALTD